MADEKEIPVIDLFAGPGGLGEGFSASLSADGFRQYKIVLSIEMEHWAHKTLELRSFFPSIPEPSGPSGLLRSSAR